MMTVEALISLSGQQPGPPQAGDVLVTRPPGWRWGEWEHMGNGLVVVSMTLTPEQEALMLEAAPDLGRARYVPVWDLVDLPTVRAARWLVMPCPPVAVRR